MSSDKVIHVTDANFEDEVLKSGLPVLVDFWAEWCAPCRNLSPVIDEIAAEYDGKVKITKLNVEENTATPSKYGIRSIPALLIFKDGENVNSMVGSAPKAKLKSFIDDTI